MLSFPSSFLLVLCIILHSNTSSNIMTSFCLSTDPRSHIAEGPIPEECCVDFSFTLPASKPSAQHHERRGDCRERVVMFQTSSDVCDDHEAEWLPKVIQAFDWCVTKGYVPKRDRSEISPINIKQFLDAVTSEDCCFLFSQTPANIFTIQGVKTSDGCEQISFNVTRQANTRNCTGNHISLAREFIRTTYNCLRWAF